MMIIIRYWLFFLIGCAFFYFIFYGPTLGHDAEHPELDQWYSELKNSNGAWCCDKNDFDKGTAAHVADNDWEVKDGHYRVNIEGQWEDVPDSAIIPGPNKDGRTLVWFYHAWNSMSGQGHNVIRCFMPGAGT